MSALHTIAPFGSRAAPTSLTCTCCVCLPFLVRCALQSATPCVHSTLYNFPTQAPYLLFVSPTICLFIPLRPPPPSPAPSPTPLKPLPTYYHHPSLSNPTSVHPAVLSTAMKSPTSAPQPDSTPIPREQELVFLALHHLHRHDTNPSIRAALSSLEAALSSSRLLPTTIDYTGEEKSLSYNQCVLRFSHVSPSYLRDVLQTHLPKNLPCTTSLLARGKYSTVLRKRPRPSTLDAIKARWSPHATSNVATLVDQQTYLNARVPFDRATFALLPKAYRKLKRLVGHHLPVFTAVFDHSSRRLITGSDDHLIKIWSTDTGYLQHTLRGHDGDIIEIVKHPTRSIIVSASADTTLRVWDIDSGAALYVLDGGSKDVNAVQFSPCPDRPYVVSGGADGSVRLWNADEFSAGFIRIPIPDRYPSRPTAALSTDTRGRGSAVAAATSRAAPPSPVPENPHQLMASVSTPAASSVAPAPAPSSSAATLLTTAFPRADDRSASISAPTGTIHLQRAPSDPPQSRYPPANSIVSGTPMYGVLSVGFNAGATRLAVGGTDCTVYLYAVDRDEHSYSTFPHIRLLTALKGHSEHVIQVLFSRTGDRIVTASRDGTARIWTRTKARLALGKKRKQSVAGMGHWSSVILDCRPQMQADARSVLSGAASGSVCGSIAPRTRRPIFPVTVDAAMWSLTDRYVFTASSDAKIRVWDAETGKLVRVLEEHEREVYVMDCHPTDKRILLSAGYDGKCILWDIETGRQLKKFSVATDSWDQSAPFGSPRRPSISDGQFSSDGLSFAVSDTSGAITLFGVGSPEAMALAPEEQFFSTDCTPYRRDEQRRAIDEYTGLLLHLVPKGRLCNRELRPHPPEVQPTVSPPFYGEETHPEKGDRTDVKISRSPLSNEVQNKNRDALLMRAKEFREYQEKEERRLLREAREARRRLIVEKEKAALERDLLPFQLALKDFVQDSDCDDSDEDFDGENAQERSESSSSSEGEDKVRPARQQRDSARTSKLQRTRRARCRHHSRPGLRRHPLYGENMVESGDSDDRGDESPGYQAESRNSDSENSMSSSDGEERGVSQREEKGPREIGNSHQTSKYICGEKSAPTTSVGPSKTRENTSPSLPRASIQHTAPKLRGASAADGTRRMKINLNNAIGAAPSSIKIASSQNATAARAADSEPPRLGMELTDNNVVANSFGSVDGRGQASDIALIGVHTPMNPSFTSERKDDGIDRTGSCKTVEECQGDDASSIRPRMMDNTEQQGEGIDSLDNLTQQHSFRAKSPSLQPALKVLVDSASNSDVGNENFPAQRSMLSDSPACHKKRNWKTRTRSGIAKNDDVEAVAPVVDIDELADKELQLLEADGSRRHSKRKRRRSTPDYSEEDCSSDEAEQKRQKKVDRESIDGPRRSRKRGKGASMSGFREKYASEDCKDGTVGPSASAWLRSTSNRYTYIPQLGDDVMYFPEGHTSAISISREAGFDPLLGRSACKKSGKEMLDGTTFPKDSSPVRFQIVDMGYEFPVSFLSHRQRSMNAKSKGNTPPGGQNSAKWKTVAVLTLRAISGMKKRVNQNDRFVLTYYPVDAPEYLVLTGRVEAALCRSWKAFDRFRILFLNEQRAWQYYTGIIKRVKPSLKTVMWNTVEVEYDNEGEKEKGVCELVSPWELETHDLTQGVREASLQYSQTLRSSTVEPGLFPLIAREIEQIRAMESNWRAQLSCLDTVDMLASISGYCRKIPCPMDLNTLLVRLCTGYYRHFCSFMHDISLLKSNAINFHGPRSEMGMLCMNLFTRLAETAERLRLQFVAAMVPMHSPIPTQGTPMSQTGSRAIRPRPAFHESVVISGPSAGQGGISNSSKQFPVPQTPRHTGASSSFPPHYSEAVCGAALQQKQLASLRQSQNAVQGSMAFGGQCTSVGLPPILPGMAYPAVVSRGGRSSRGRTREQQSIRQNGSGQQRGASVGATTRGNAPSPTPPSSGLSHSIGLVPNASPFYMNPQIGQSSQFQLGQASGMAKTSQTIEEAGGDAKRFAPSSSFSQGRGGAKPLTQPGVGHIMANIVTPDNGVATNSRPYGGNSVPSPLQGAGTPALNGVSLSFTLPSPHASMSRHQRGASNVVDGGTHSWGRSMEGAGGMFPLQASTSDSHLPVRTQTGRSSSPTSPSPGRRDTLNPSSRQQISVGLGTGTPYHEHSTVSVAAAESTMSCGGAEVALQAASAESAELAPERPRS